MESMLCKARQREQTEQEELKGAAAGSTDSKEKREVEAGREDAMRNEEEWRNIVVKNKISLEIGTVPISECVPVRMSRPGQSTVKAGRHDGQPPWEAYQAKSMLCKARQREQTEQEELKGAAAGSTDSKEKREVEAGREDAMRNEEEWRNIVVKNKVTSPCTTPAEGSDVTPRWLAGQ
ncbi:UNVERIFIED_CONTAM: hypothetical protein FKN15_068431 [Acipenser sinensis]